MPVSIRTNSPAANCLRSSIRAMKLCTEIFFLPLIAEFSRQKNGVGDFKRSTRRPDQFLGGWIEDVLNWIALRVLTLF